MLLSIGLVFIVVAGALEATAQFAERRLGAYLWKKQDHLRLLSPSYHAGRGRGRLFIYGPSEAREGLLPEELERNGTRLSPYQGAQSLGTLEDGLVVLDYLDRAYGGSATPDALLLGITTRFVADIRTRPSPLFEGIDKYSPHLKLIDANHPPALGPKSAIEKVQAHLALAALQPDRYRRGVFAVTNHFFGAVVPVLAAYEREMIRPANYFLEKDLSDEVARERLIMPGYHWEKVHAWDPESDRARVTRSFTKLLEFTARHRIRLYVVNLPEHSWNRELYRPGRYESYLNVVTAALGDTPFLDLRTFLSDDEFYDEAHAKWNGAIRIGREVGAFIRAHEAATQALRP